MAGALTIWSDAARSRYELAKVPRFAEAFTPTERRVFKASFGKPFNAYTDKELIIALAEPVRCAMFDAGIKAGDQSEQAYRITRLSTILKRYYGILTIDDFKQAFEMLTLGELDKFLPRRDGTADRSHYGVFNVEYVAKVLNAYVRQRDLVMTTAEKMRPKEAPKPDEETYKGVRRAMWHDFLFYKYKGYVPPMGDATVVVYYKIFARLGWVDASMAELTREEQEAVILSAAASIGGGRSFEDDRMRWKRREIERAFRDLVEDEVQLDKYLGL